ncbi:uncharacterized protein [Macaca fascicularis]|uniref:uncharacterized protein n=1 Tax=Macaca fascicularis TaxID=9541 RepID=UPI0032B083E2
MRWPQRPWGSRRPGPGCGRSCLSHCFNSSELIKRREGPRDLPEDVWIGGGGVQGFPTLPISIPQNVLGIPAHRKAQWPRPVEGSWRRAEEDTRGRGRGCGAGPEARTPGQVRGAAREDLGRWERPGGGRTRKGTRTGRRAEEGDGNRDGNGNKGQGTERRGAEKGMKTGPGGPRGGLRAGIRVATQPRAAPDVSAARWDRTYRKQNPRGRSRWLFGSKTKWSPAGAAWAPLGTSPATAGVPGGLEVLPRVSMPPVFVSLSLLCGNVLFKGDNGEPRNNTGEITQPWSTRPSSRFIIRKQNTQLQYK